MIKPRIKIFRKTQMLEGDCDYLEKLVNDFVRKKEKSGCHIKNILSSEFNSIITIIIIYEL